jgi:Family of unknown function (DUF5989)
MSEQPNEFEKAEAEEGRTGFIGEYLGFLRHNKKWWLLPILVILFLIAALLLLSSTAAGPFIYTLF